MDMNQRPSDPAWEEACDKLAEAAAHELNSLVVVIAAQDMGKMGISIGGKELPGEELQTVAAMAAKSMPLFLLHLARIAWLQDQKRKPKPPPGEGPRIVIEPGAFDDFDGTPEELAELLADIRNKFASGAAFMEARALTEEEQDALRERIAAAAKRRARPQ